MLDTVPVLYRNYLSSLFETPNRFRPCRLMGPNLFSVDQSCQHRGIKPITERPTLNSRRNSLSVRDFFCIDSIIRPSCILVGATHSIHGNQNHCPTFGYFLGLCRAGLRCNHDLSSLWKLHLAGFL